MAACGNDHSQSETTAAFEDLDLSAYDDLNTGEVILVRSDGNIEIWDNSDDSSGIDLFLYGDESDEVALEENYDGAILVAKLKVLATRTDFLSNSGDTFDTALELAELEKVGGLDAATQLTAEVSRDDVVEENIHVGDTVLIASADFDFKHQNLYAPVKVKKVKSDIEKILEKSQESENETE